MQPTSDSDNRLTAADQHASPRPYVEISQSTDANGTSVTADWHWITADWHWITADWHWITADWHWITADGEKLPANGELQQRIYYFHFDPEGHIADYTYQ